VKKEDLYTVGMVAGELGISRQRVHYKIANGDFPSAFQLADGTWLIEKKDLERNRVRNPGRPKKEAKK
jgi:hypothetical protein